MMRSRAGLTLLEILVALSVMGLIGLFTWQTISATTDTRTLLEEAQNRDRQLDAAINRIERELNLAFLTDSIEAVGTYQTLFVGDDGGEQDMLYFTTTAHQPKIRGVRECDQAEITLWTEPDPNGGLGDILYHRESGRIDERPDEGGVITPLLYNVTQFDLRFLDPQSYEWREEWNSLGIETNRLPRVVQLIIGLHQPSVDDPEEYTETTVLRTIIIESADEIMRTVLNSAPGGAGEGVPSGFGGLGL